MGVECVVAFVRAQSSFVEQIREAQSKDPKLKKLMEEVRSGKNSNFTLDREGALRCGNHLCVPYMGELKNIILEEAHNSKYTIHVTP